MQEDFCFLLYIYSLDLCQWLGIHTVSQWIAWCIDYPIDEKLRL